MHGLYHVYSPQHGATRACLVQERHQSPLVHLGKAKEARNRKTTWLGTRCQGSPPLTVMSYEFGLKFHQLQTYLPYTLVIKTT